MFKAVAVVIVLMIATQLVLFFVPITLSTHVLKNVLLNGIIVLRVVMMDMTQVVEYVCLIAI